MILKAIQELPDGSYLAKIYPTPYDRTKDRKGIVVRVIKYTLDDPQRVGHGEEHTLLTTLLDAAEHPAMELILLYHERWEEELTFDEQKTHHDPVRPGKATHLRSETPQGIVQEVYALSLGHYVTRALMAQAAATAKLDPDWLSFVGCLRILKCRLPECDSRTATKLARVVRSVAVGDELRARGPATNTHGPAAPQPHQSARDQAARCPTGKRSGPSIATDLPCRKPLSNQ